MTRDLAALSAMMSKSATLPAPAPTKAGQQAPPAAASNARKDQQSNGGGGGGGVGGSKRTVTNVRKAIEDAAMYNSSKETATDNDYEGDKATIRKDRKAAQDEDRKMVEELNAWGRSGGGWDDDDGDDF